ncbi:MAG: hypothetical protein AAGB05_01955 [Pseudomonadota bacterium]
MSEYLPQTVREELARGTLRSRQTSSRARIVADGREYPVLRRWARGFAVDMNAGAPPLRGLVDLYDGQRFVCKALVFATSESGCERIYEFKFANRAGPVMPPADFARDPV